MNILKYDIFRGASKIATVTPRGEREEGFMLVDATEMSFTLPEYVEFLKGDTVTIFGTVMTLDRPSAFERNSAWSYTLRFLGPSAKLSDVFMYGYDENNQLTEYECNFTGTAPAVIDFILANLNRVHSGWTKGVIDTSEAADFNFTGDTVASALIKVADFYKTEIWLSGNSVVNLSKKGNNSGLSFEYGKGKGLTSLKRDNKDSKLVTKLRVLGSSQNMPSTYPGVSKRLRMPGNQLFIQDAAKIALYGPIEDTKIFDDIFPKRIGSVTSVTSELKFADTTIDFDINNQYYPGVPAKVKFITGQLAGWQFEIAENGYNHNTKTINILVNKDEKSIEVPSSALKPAIGDKYVLLDIQMPTSYVTAAEIELKQKGEEFYATVCDPAIQFNAATDRRYLRDNNISPALGDYVKIKDTTAGIDKNIRIISKRTNLQNRYDVTLTLADSVTISNVVQRIIQEQTVQRVISLNQLTDINRARQNRKTQAEVLNMIFNPDTGQYYTSKIDVDDLSARIIKVGTVAGDFSLQATFRPNFAGLTNSFAWTAGNLAHNQLTDYQNGIWSFSAGTIANLDPARPYYIYLNAPFTSATGFIELSTVRQKVDQAQGRYAFLVGILSSVTDGYRVVTNTYGTTTINGRQLNTGVVANTAGQPFIDIDNRNIIGSVTFTDGLDAQTAISNAQTTASNAENKIDTLPYLGENLISVLPENWENRGLNSALQNGTAWLDMLSQNTVISPTRLRTKLLYNVGAGCVISWDSSKFDIVPFFWDATDKFTSNGVGWITSSPYIVQTSHAKVAILLRRKDSSNISVIEAEVAKVKVEPGNKYTAFQYSVADVAVMKNKAIQGAAANDYVTNTLPQDLASLQNQIDNVEENYFFNYDPTPTNLPASAWTTLALKEQHQGDTFTNTLTLKSYKWVNRASVPAGSSDTRTGWNWYEITNSDAANALAKAADALGLAQTKRRVFGGADSPKTPYEINDIWFDANGDAWRCTTTRISGSFILSDWTKATKYTDDTAANQVRSDLVITNSSLQQAQNSLSALTSTLADVTNNNLIDKSEQLAEKLRWDTIQGEQPTLIAQANTYGIGSAVYTSAYNALNSYIASLSGFGDVTKDTSIVGATYNNLHLAYANAKIALLRAVTDAAKGLVDNIKVGTVNLLNGSWSDFKTVPVGLQSIVADVAAYRGQQLSFSLWCDSPTTTKNFQLYKNGTIAEVTVNFPVATGKQFKVITFTVANDANTYQLYSHGANGSSSIAMQMLTPGNKAGDWQPSNADTQNKITAAQSAADNARAAADTANNAILTINAQISELSADNKLTPSEKIATNLIWQGIKADYVNITADAAKYNLSTADYTSKYSLLNSYITPLLSDMTITSSVVSSTFNATFNNVVVAAATVRSSIASAAIDILTALRSDIGTLQTNLSNATQNLTTLTNTVNKVTSDSWLDVSEKPQALLDWNKIKGEYTIVVAQAAAYGVSTATLTTAYNALNNYITPLLASLVVDSSIVGSEYRQRFLDYANAEVSVRKLITDKAQSNLNDYKLSNDAILSSVKSAAETAKSDIGTINTSLLKISDDNNLSPNKKQQVVILWKQIQNNYTTDISEAAKYNVSTSLYTSAYNALNSYITPLLSNLATDSSIVGTTYRSNFDAILNARVSVRDAIVTAAKLLVDTLPYLGENVISVLPENWGNRSLDSSLPNGMSWLDMLSQNTPSVPSRLLSKLLYNIGAGCTISWDSEKYDIVPFFYDASDKYTSAGIGWITSSPYIVQTPHAKVTILLRRKDNSNISVSEAEVAKVKVEPGNKYTAFQYSVADVAAMKNKVIEAQQNIADALKTINNITSDNVIDKGEKGKEILRYSSAQSEYSTRLNQAGAYNISTALLSSKYSALSTFIASIPSFNSVDIDSSVDGATYRTRYAEFYTESNNVFRAVTDAAKGIVDNIKVGGDNLFSNSGFAKDESLLSKNLADLPVVYRSDNTNLDNTVCPVGSRTIGYYLSGTSAYDAYFVFAQRISVVAGTEHVISFYYSFGGAAVASNCYILPSTGNPINIPLSGTNNVWNRASFVYTPASGVTWFRLRLGFAKSAIGPMWAYFGGIYAGVGNKAPMGAISSKDIDLKISDLSTVVENMSGDGQLDKGEKLQLSILWDSIQKRYNTNIADAGQYTGPDTINTAAYATAYNTLNQYITAIFNQAGVSSIDPATFKANFQTFTTRQTEVESALSIKRKLALDNARQANVVLEKTKKVIDFTTSTTDSVGFAGGTILFGDAGGGNGGLSGITDNGIYSIRIFSGSDYLDKNSAPFRVNHAGDLYARKAFIRGMFVTGGVETLNTSTGDMTVTGRRIEISSTANSIVFYDDNNTPLAQLSDNVDNYYDDDAASTGTMPTNRPLAGMRFIKKFSSNPSNPDMVNITGNGVYSNAAGVQSPMSTGYTAYGTIVGYLRRLVSPNSGDINAAIVGTSMLKNGIGGWFSNLAGGVGLQVEGLTVVNNIAVKIASINTNTIQLTNETVVIKWGSGTGYAILPDVSKIKDGTIVLATKSEGVIQLKSIGQPIYYPGNSVSPNQYWNVGNGVALILSGNAWYTLFKY